MMSSMLRDTFENIKREKFLAVTNIFVMVMTFVTLGVLVSIVFVSQSILHYLENQAQVTVFFKDDFPESSILAAQEALRGDERVSEVRYVSKEEAFKIFMEINKDEPVLLESVSSNILPASLEIKASRLAYLNPLAEEMAQLEGVEEVKFFRDVIERFRLISNVTYVVGFSLVFIFLAISYAMTMSTLRMAINTKRSELEIQKLVGASNEYVKRPLVFQGMFFGLVAAFISAVILVLTSVGLYFAGIFGGGILLFGGISVNIILFTAILGALLVAFGTFLGYLGSNLTIKKYLDY